MSITLIEFQSMPCVAAVSCFVIRQFRTYKTKSSIKKFRNNELDKKILKDIVDLIKSKGVYLLCVF